MRLICSIPENDPHLNGYELSYYLTSQGIENECEEAIEKEETLLNIWVIDEDQYNQAQEIFQEYIKDPKNQKYHAHYDEAVEKQEKRFVEEPPPRPTRRRFLSPSPYGPISILIILIAIALFFWSQIQRDSFVPPKLKGIVHAPLLAPVEQNLIYDYPPYFALYGRLFKLFTPEEIKQKQNPSPEAVSVIKELQTTPVWMGIYDPIVARLKNGERAQAWDAPMFYSIRHGEVWRLFTPALVHFDLLHIFFNILWFILLGNQIEFRLGKLRYIFLILATGIISNTAQYLMSGPFFMGLSGIVCGMAAFIWARQQIAPWEGYLLHRFTLIFLSIFVVGMFLLQTIFFFMQIFGNFELTIGIANTAHLSGALVGYLLGRSRLFALKHRK